MLAAARRSSRPTLWIQSVLKARPAFWILAIASKREGLHKAFCPGPGMGLYEFCRMPFGGTGGPSSFQRLMDKVLHGLPFATSYTDDVLVHSPNMKCHLQHLQQVFERLANAGLTLRGSKCQFGLDKVHYLRHVFSEAGMSPDKEKIAVIKDWPISNANADALSCVPTIPSTCAGTVTVPNSL